MKAAAALISSSGRKSLPFRNRINVSRLVSAQYTPEYRLSLSGEVIAEDPYHPLRLKLEKSRAERDHRGLWWHVHSNLELSNKRIVRSWAQRRVRHAFQDALSLRGYDALGIPSAQTSTPSRAMKELRGTLRILPSQVSIPATYDTLKVECLKLVDEIIGRCNTSALPMSEKMRTVKRLS